MLNGLIPKRHGPVKSLECPPLCVTAAAGMRETPAPVVTAGHIRVATLDHGIGQRTRHVAVDRHVCPQLGNVPRAAHRRSAVLAFCTGLARGRAHFNPAKGE